MSDNLPSRPLDITNLAAYTNKISELSSVSKMMAPVYLRDFIIGQDIAMNLLARAVQADAKAKAKLEYAQSIAYLENAKVLLFRDYSQTKSEINFNEFCNSLKNMVLLNDYLRKMK